MFHEQFRLLPVDTAHGLLSRIFREIALGRIEPYDGSVQSQDSPPTYLGSGFEFVMIEPLGGEAHDILVHTILDLQERDSFRFRVGYLLHQGTS